MAARATTSRCLLLLSLVGVAARAASGVIDGLLANGNFELGPDKSELNGTRVISPTAVPSWEITGFVEYIESGQMQGDMILPVPDGARAVRLGNGASIRQKLTSLTRRTHYSVTFCAARTCGQDEKVRVSVVSDSGVLPIQTVYTSSGWDCYSWAFKARHTTAWLSILNPDSEVDEACGPLIDSVAIKTLHHPPHTKDGVLKNGGFEEGPYIFPNSPWGVLVPPITEDDNSPLPEWTIMSDTKVVKYVDAQHFAVPQGAYAVELVAGRETALVQEVHTAPGRSYKLSFSVGDAGNGCRGSLVVEAYAALGSVKVPYESRGTGGHRRAELEFAAVDSVTRVVFQSLNYLMKPDGTLCGPVLDDISLVRLPKRHAARRLFM